MKTIENTGFERICRKDLTVSFNRIVYRDIYINEKNAGHINEMHSACSFQSIFLYNDKLT